ncbi:MAG TPA: hypothetical protein VM577_08770 [Anaerovoracaceae bacterium]|nr:hypothetical protein [Anaerovoracaceae bacterium]
MNWLKEKLQDARELVAKPVEWAQANKHKPVIQAIQTKDYVKLRFRQAKYYVEYKVQEAIARAEEERDKDSK